MPSFKMPTPIRRPTSDFYWIRKKVPLPLRPLVGKTEVWASLGTKDLKTAVQRCTAASAALEAEWARLVAAARRPTPAPDFERARLTHQDLLGLQRVVHVRAFDQLKADPPVGFAALRRLHRDKDEEATELLEREGFDASDENVERVVPMLGRAKMGVLDDLKRAALAHDYSENRALAKLPKFEKPALDFVQWFETYVAKAGLKGGKFGPTAKRWRPKILAFCKWLGHRDLTRMKATDAYRWVDHLKEQGYEHESIKKVWIASLSATAGFAKERREIDQNPFLQITVRPPDPADNEEDAEPVPIEPRTKGYSFEEAKKILTATLAEPSHLISVEMRAARRWLPWLCAYSGARVNELTSLYPKDIFQDKASGIWCMSIKPSLEKTAQLRVVPIHSHVIDQEFLDYRDRREKLGKPLFYDPARSRGGKAGNPQFKKVAERLAEWLHSLGLIPEGVQPNHAWRHLFKSMARHLKMDREVEGFITGHRPKDSNAGHDYGDRWVKTMAAEIEKYPRFDIPALKSVPAPHKRHRRTNAEVAKAKAAKERRKVARFARAIKAK
jgi:site-specific recombinase XerD